MRKASISKIKSKFRAISAGSKYSKKHSYSSFWMDDTWDASSKFGGLTGEESGTSDLIKAIKLSAYQRAIANFTKILTKKDIHVVFGGDQSYTDGKTISISTAIKDNNFDVQVGLALHEASHCILTDFDCRGKYFAQANLTYDAQETISSLTNWVEDRRIDLFVFKSCPGYKAYYHKLYDEYFNDPAIDKGFASKDFRKPTVDAYMFHIINMINPLFNPAVLPGLEEITKIIDLRNISRLQSTQDALDVAVQVWGIIERETQKAAQQQQYKTPQNGSGSGEEQPQQQQNGESPMTGDQEEKSTDKSQSMQAEGEGKEGEETDEEGGDSATGTQELSLKEQAALGKAMRQQRKFVDGKFDRKSATKKLQQKLDEATKSGVEVQSVFGGKIECLVYDITKNAGFADALSLWDAYTTANIAYHNARSGQDDAARKVRNAAHDAYTKHPLGDLVSRFFGNSSADENKAVDEGLQLGAMLGRKLQLRNETRDLTVNRLNSGKLDAKRISHAGYGIENVFKQVYVDKHKSSVIHISLDASGSMSGEKWENAITMTAAIAKAATMCTNLRVQVSLRHTQGMGMTTVPVVVMIYDSAKRTPLSMLVRALKAAYWPSMTPEGLCYEAMWSKGMLVGSASDVDSYFLNISDGAPGGCGSRSVDYCGTQAYKHTRKFIDKMRNEKGIQVLSFFVKDHMEPGTKPSESFKEMYGANDAFCIGAKDMIGIARALNNKFLAAKVTV
jgi:hypothetical protein